MVVKQRSHGVIYNTGYTNNYYNIILYNIVQHRLYNNDYKINKSKGGIQQSGCMELFLVGKAFSNSHYLVKPAYGLHCKEPLPGMRCAAHRTSLKRNHTCQKKGRHKKAVIIANHCLENYAILKHSLRFSKLCTFLHVCLFEISGKNSIFQSL